MHSFERGEGNRLDIGALFLPGEAAELVLPEPCRGKAIEMINSYDPWLQFVVVYINWLPRLRRRVSYRVQLLRRGEEW